MYSKSTGSSTTRQNGKPSPRLYSEMVAEDRRIRLTGYEVYRFGGWELMQADADELLQRFFGELVG